MMYVCQICGYRTDDLEDYADHLDMHVSDRNYDPDNFEWLQQERSLMELEEDIKKAMSREGKLDD